MRTAAVTGGMSSIGRYIVDLLLEKGWHVKVLTRKDGVEPWHPNIEIVHGDIRNEDAVLSLVSGATAIFHCAAEFHNADLIWQVNVKATEQLLSVIKRSKVDYFCYISSAGVLGAWNGGVVDESTPCKPRDIYEESKLMAEQLVMNAHLDAKVCALRPVFVVSSQRPGFVDYAMRNNWMDKLKIFIKGGEGAHIVHARDVAAAAVYFLDVPLPKPECFFVACDEDELNTIAGIVAYYSYVHAGEKGGIKLPLFVPKIIPHLIRSIFRGPSLYGGVRFSSAKLRGHGFVFPLGFRGAIKEIEGSK